MLGNDFIKLVFRDNVLLRNRYDDYLQSEGSQEDEKSLCGNLMHLADIVLDFFEANGMNDDQMPMFFKNLDLFLQQCDDSDTLKAFEICFFETILNCLANESEKHIELLSKLLGPKSRELCIRNDEFWGTKLIK